MVSPRKADSGQARGCAGTVTSELWALRAIHRTAAATDTSSRSSDSKTAAIPVRALECDCAGAGAPRAAWEGRSRPAERPLGGWAEGRGRGAEPGLPRAEFGLRPSGRAAAGSAPPDHSPVARQAEPAAPRSARPSSGCPGARGDLWGLDMTGDRGPGRADGW